MIDADARGMTIDAGGVGIDARQVGIDASEVAVDACQVAIDPREVGIDARVEAAWRVLDGVPDPEVPAVSVRDLGIVRDVIGRGDGLEVVLTPTYSGCPATEAIAADVVAALAAAGLGPARVTLRRAPAWTSDWVSEKGRQKLLAHGIAPPGPADAAAAPVRFFGRGGAARLACPRCASLRTERLSAFGSTACKALHRCLACGEPFEHFKPI